MRICKKEGDVRFMVAVVTNSICDLSPEMAEEYGVLMIPDVIIFSESEQFRNNLEIDPPTLFARLPKCEQLPTTAHPNLQLNMDTFRKAAEYADEILCISPTSKMSGAYATACSSRTLLMEQGFPTPITVYDSLQVSFGLGTLVREAAKLARQNCSAAEIVAQLDVIRPKVGVYFAMQSLEYARRGGRVGAIRVLAADLLKVKPILTFKDGLVKDIGVVRGYSNAVDHVVELYRKRAAFGGDVLLFHSDREELARQIRQQLLEMDPDCRVRIGWVGAVIGVYTGPGCVGLAFLEKDT